MSETKYYNVEVKENEVDPAKVKLANLMADYCEKHFHTGRPKVRWFKKTTEADFRVLMVMFNLQKASGYRSSGLPYFGAFDESPAGFFALQEDLKDSIFLREDLGDYELMAVFCHELFHFQKGVKVGAEYGDDLDPAAEKYKERLMLELRKSVLFSG